MDERIKKESDCRLHEYRLNELTDNLKELKIDIKDLDNKVDEKFDLMTETLLKSQNDMFEKLIKNNEIQQTGKIAKSNNKTNIITGIIAAVISVIVGILTKII